MPSVPINSPPESSEEEESSDSEVPYPSEDDSMEDEPSETENTNGIVTEAEANGTKDEFWVRYPSLKTFLIKMIGVVSKDYMADYCFFEKAKLIGDEKAKELNDRCKALCNKEMELCSNKIGLFSDAISLIIKP